MDNNIFVAINGDLVGDSIGQAIASDNSEELSRVSGAVKDSHSKIEEWVKSVGGRVVASSGDEGVFSIAPEHANQLEKIRGDYAQSAGHTLTIGIGNSISEASKALLYAKDNGRDQITEYEPAIEDYINGENEEEEELPVEADLQENVDADIEQEAGVVEQESVPEHEEGMNVEENAVHDQQEQVSDELDNDIVEADEETAEGSSMQSTPEEGVESYEDGVGDDSDFVEEDSVGVKGSEQLVNEAVGEEDLDGIDGDINGQDPDFVDQDQEIASEDEAGMESEEAQSHQQALTDMISGHMSEDVEAEMAGEGEMAPEGQEQMQMSPEEEQAAMMEQEQGQQAAPEEMVEQEQMPEGQEEMMAQEEGEADESDEELKADITSALMSFKQNKQMLEETQQSNPELYQATITMLRSMISMSKKLGFTSAMDEMEQMPEGQEEEEISEEEYQEMSESDVAGPENEEEIEEAEEAPPEMIGAEDEDEELEVKKQ